MWIEQWNRFQYIISHISNPHKHKHSILERYVFRHSTALPPKHTKLVWCDEKKSTSMIPCIHFNFSCNIVRHSSFYLVAKNLSKCLSISQCGCISNWRWNLALCANHDRSEILNGAQFHAGVWVSLVKNLHKSHEFMVDFHTISNTVWCEIQTTRLYFNKNKYIEVI